MLDTMQISRNHASNVHQEVLALEDQQDAYSARKVDIPLVLLVLNVCNVLEVTLLIYLV